MKKQILASLCSIVLCSPGAAGAKQPAANKDCPPPPTGTWIVRSAEYVAPFGTKLKPIQSDVDSVIGKRVSFSKDVVFFVDGLCGVKSVRTYIPDPVLRKSVPELSDEIQVTYECSTAMDLPMIRFGKDCKTAHFLIDDAMFTMTRKDP